MSASLETPAASVPMQQTNRRAGKLRRGIRSLLKSKTGTLGMLIIVIFTFMALFAGQLAPQDPAKQNVALRLKPPMWLEGGKADFPLGTDNLGRDILSRIIYGSQVSLLVGICSVIIAGLIGVLLGLVSGYFGGWIDMVIMRIVDAFLAIPNILFTLVILSVLGPGLVTLILVLGITNWTNYARIVRGEVLSIKERDFVRAARSVGARDARIIFTHILPNVASSFIVISTLSVATTIILEASLSFLGLGIQPPTVSWGGMLSDGRDYVATSWWIATFPGLAITLTVLGIIFLGDWLRDVLDPRMKQKAK
ncbi:ABC transporter permease [Brevibacillus sp. B_LB10_24]|uniref:ABC transporter permease n=1 Tax=Brevibacillus sp. B_LB10_24 TaxID=3380645 RepID=UPI0038B85EA3